MSNFQEQLDNIMSGMSQEQLVERIKICQEVVDKLGSDPIWESVLKDADNWVKRLDSSWQEIYDEEKLNGLRVLKLAYAHIASLPNKYKEDLKAATRALDAKRNTDSSIEKDYDNETILEST